jgi:hypothetical protein
MTETCCGSVDGPIIALLIVGVCILLRVLDQGERVFPSTQRYYTRFLIFIIHLTATCCGCTTIFRKNIFIRNYSIDNGFVVFRILVNITDNKNIDQLILSTIVPIYLIQQQ